ncbi:MAG TPA: tetratricopeptide repeat protein [Armatimonadetes bacterium]|nr:tetratricopeptide repeat protein [Armatimonadota bacterium]
MFRNWKCMLINAFMSIGVMLVSICSIYPATPDEDFAFAVKLYQNGEYELAAEEFDKFAKAYPDDDRVPEALAALGDCYFRLKRYDDAAKAFQRAAQIARERGKDKVASRATYWVAEAYYQLQRYDDAINWYQQVLQRYPKGNEAPYALYSIGLAYRDKQQPQKALPFFQRVVNEFPESDVAPTCQWLIGECYFDLKRLHDAERAYQQVIQRYPKSKEVADARAGLAWVKFEQKQYEEAARRFAEVARLHPDTPAGKEAIVRQADCYFNLKRYDQALELYRQVAQQKQHPYADHAIYWSGECLSRLKQYQNAATQFLLLIRTKPRSPYIARAYAALADAYMAMGRYGEAVQALNVALKGTKDAKQLTLLKCALAECLMKQKKFDEAVQIVQELVTTAPKDTRVQAVVATLIAELMRGGKIEVVQPLLAKFNFSGAVADQIASTIFDAGKPHTIARTTQRRTACISCCWNTSRKVTSHQQDYLHSARCITRRRNLKMLPMPTGS